MTEKESQVTKLGDVPKPQGRPEGWWALAGLEGSRIGVLAAIDASDIPNGWKAALCSEINALDVQLNHVKLDAHHQRENGHLLFSVHIKSSKVL